MKTAVATKTKWAIDAAHSEVQFKVKHLVISTVTGTFKKFNGSLEADEESFDGADVEFTIDASSIDTNQNDRDNHLKSDDFFSADKYKEITFRNGKLHEVKNGYTLVGDLTIRDVTKTIELDVEYGGTMVDPWGNTKVGFEVSGKINRKDYGLNWNALTEAGGVLVGEEVKLNINVQLARV